MQDIVRLLEENRQLDAELKVALRESEAQLRSCYTDQELLARHELAVRARAPALQGDAAPPDAMDGGEVQAQ